MCYLQQYKPLQDHKPHNSYLMGDKHFSASKLHSGLATFQDTPCWCAVGDWRLQHTYTTTQPHHTCKIMVQSK